jgi:RNA polymerase-binding transcription factor
MARDAAFLRLQKTLLARKEELRRLLADELASLHDFKGVDATGDSADLAFEAGSEEMACRLAEMDARELMQIEQVLTRLQRGTYGLCEGGSLQCQRKIPVARLKALPHALLCINCEREREKNSGGPYLKSRGNWAQVYAFQPPTEDRRVNASKLELNLPGNRRD